MQQIVPPGQRNPEVGITAGATSLRRTLQAVSICKAEVKNSRARKNHIQQSCPAVLLPK